MKTQTKQVIHNHEQIYILTHPKKTHKNNNNEQPKKLYKKCLSWIREWYSMKMSQFDENCLEAR